MGCTLIWGESRFRRQREEGEDVGMGTGMERGDVGMGRGMGPSMHFHM